MRIHSDLPWLALRRPRGERRIARRGRSGELRSAGCGRKAPATAGASARPRRPIARRADRVGSVRAAERRGIGRLCSSARFVDLKGRRQATKIAVAALARDDAARRRSCARRACARPRTRSARPDRRQAGNRRAANGARAPRPCAKRRPAPGRSPGRQRPATSRRSASARRSGPGRSLRYRAGRRDRRRRGSSELVGWGRICGDRAKGSSTPARGRTGSPRGVAGTENRSNTRQIRRRA